MNEFCEFKSSIDPAKKNSFFVVFMSQAIIKKLLTRVDSDRVSFGVLDSSKKVFANRAKFWKALFHRKFLSSFLLILTQI